MFKAVHTLVKLKTSRGDIEGDFPVNEGVKAALPDGPTLLSAHNYDFSAWTVTARLRTRLANGTLKEFFLKVAAEDTGRTMIEGEFHLTKELRTAMPSFVPFPITWGRYKNPEHPTYFFMSDFIEMRNELPEPVQSCAKLAELHRSSVSPTGQFGFHKSTCHGRFPQAVSWDPNWASFFGKLLQAALDIDIASSPEWKEYEEVAARAVSHVVPRLLGALQSERRTLKPCLIHGDLWEGNIGTDVATREIYIFDAGAYYAHHEMELGMWRCERQQIKSKVYKEEYLRKMPMSEPSDEFEDRNRLYCIKMNAIHSAHHPGTIARETSSC